MSDIVSSFLDLAHEESLVDRVSEIYKVNKKTVRCTIDLKSLENWIAMDFDKQRSFLKAPAQRPDYLIVSCKANDLGRIFVIEFSKSSNKRESHKVKQIQAGLKALESLVKSKHKRSDFDKAEVYPVYWGPTKKGEKDRMDSARVSFLDEKYSIKYLGCKEPILNLCKGNRAK